MNINFLTFITSDWKQSILRMQQQTGYIQRNYNLFSSVKICNESCLSEEWHDKYRRFLGIHGYALWAWKPYLIYDTLSKLNDGDVLFYADGGCSFPISDLDMFITNLKQHIVNTSKCDLKIGIEPFLRGRYPNYIIIRRQILENMGLSNDKFFLTQWLHYEAGVLILVKDETIVKFIKQWMDFFQDNFETLIYSEYKDKSGQFRGFAHNGSDQAVLQCLLYKNINRFYSILDDIFYRYNFYSRSVG